MANEIEKMIKSDKEKKLVIGFSESLRTIKTGEAGEVFIAKNCADAMRFQLKNAADLAKAQVIELSLNAEEIAAQMKKPYNITVAVILAK